MPPAPFPQPTDGVFAEDDLMDEITLLDIDQNNNMYFDTPHAWNPPIGQRQIYDEYSAIDPSLHVTTDPSAPMSVRSVVTVPEEFAEISSRILVYFARTLEVPDTSEETVLITEGLETLEPIVEEVEPIVPSILGDVCVNTAPQPMEIEEIIDLRHIDPDRQVFYLARTTEGEYYWFHIPHTEHDHHLHQLIGDYRHKSHMGIAGRKKRDERRLRSERIAEA
jgi:hypothetical protein